MIKYIYIGLLLFFSLTTHAAEVNVVMVKSKSMKKKIPNTIITPNNYKKLKDLSVLYMLHGAGGTHKMWSNLSGKDLKQFSDQNNVIIVCPDAGGKTWYFDSPIDEKLKYETYVSKELVKYIDKKYPTQRDKNGRAIVGLSMGGHGAFYLAFKHQDVFGAAGSTSGGMDIRPFSKNWDLPKTLGSFKDHQDNWETHTVINMIPLLKNTELKLIFDCGTKDFFYKVNQKMHQKLLKNNIAHDYIERPGKHNGKYWKNSIKYHLVFFKNHFNKVNN